MNFTGNFLKFFYTSEVEKSFIFFGDIFSSMILGKVLEGN